MEQFTPPSSDLDGRFNRMDSASNQITPNMIAILQSMRPWFLFFAILFFLSSGLIFFVGIAMIAMGGISGIGGEALGAVGALGIGALYILMGILYVMPGVFLFKAARAIGNMGSGGGALAMEEALLQQKKFWKYIGIVTLLIIFLYIGMFVVMIGAIGFTAAGAAG